jgi:hypothetical protein
MSALDTAREQADGPDEDPSVPWAGWLGPLYVTVHEALTTVIRQPRRT